MKARFDEVFGQLRAILQPYADSLLVKQDGPDNYSLDAPYSEKYGKELFFGAVQIKKRYVSYHLMPLYVFPDLVDTLSPALKKRLHGKSCLNFTSLDETQTEELARLTQASFEQYREAGLL